MEAGGPGTREHGGAPREGRRGAGGVRLRVLSLNAHALPFGIAPRTRERLLAIGRHLHGLRPDLAAFQECWTGESRRILVEAGALAGLRFAWHRRRAFGGGGLLLLSRDPLDGVSFTRFRVRGPPERLDQGDFLGGKGFALARAGGRLRGLTVAITHLQAAYGGDGYLAHRTAQAAELALALAERAGPLLVAGDLNAEPGSLPIALLRGLARLRDAAAEVGRPEPTTQPLAPGSPRPPRRIDYLLLRAGAATGIRVVGLRRVLDAPERLAGGDTLRPSDHAGLLADLELGPGFPDPAPAPPPPPLEAAVEVLLAGARAEARRRRAGVGGTGVAAALSLAALARARRAASRRDLLRWLLGGLGGAAAGATVLGAGVTAEIAAEARGFRELAARLPPPGDGPEPASGLRPSGAHPGAAAPSAPGQVRR